MNPRVRLSGWWRLWVLVWLVWGASVATYSYITWPSAAQAPHHPAFIYQLSPSQRDLLSAEGSSSAGTTVEMPNGHSLHFKAGVSEPACTEVARAYHDITVQAQTRARNDLTHFSLALAFIPSFVAALLGMGTAWVRSGFKREPQ